MRGDWTLLIFIAQMSCWKAVVVFADAKLLANPVSDFYFEPAGLSVHAYCDSFNEHQTHAKQGLVGQAI